MSDHDHDVHVVERSDIAVRSGDAVRSARLRAGRGLSDVAGSMGRSAAWLSRLEHGHGDGAGLGAWTQLAASLGLDMEVAFSESAAAVAQAGDAVMVDAVARIAVGGGWTLRSGTGGPGTFLELERVERRREWSRACRAVVAVWDQVPDVALAVRELDARIADLRSGVPGRDAVSGVIVVRRDAAARRRLGPHRPVVDRRFWDTGSSWIVALTDPSSVMPDHVSMCWFDPRGQRLVPMFLDFGARRRPRGRRARAGMLRRGPLRGSSCR